MTRTEQRVFVEELLSTVKQQVVEHITKGAIPAHWDGLELRVYIRDLFLEQAAKVDLGPRRTKEYRNSIAINNL